MKQRVEEEVEAVSEVLGDKTAITGFYSYGELAPFEAGRDCELHNQTMTVTVLSEAWGPHASAAQASDKEIRQPRGRDPRGSR